MTETSLDSLFFLTFPDLIPDCVFRETDLPAGALVFLALKQCSPESRRNILQMARSVILAYEQLSGLNPAPLAYSSEVN